MKTIMVLWMNCLMLLYLFLKRNNFISADTTPTVPTENNELLGNLESSDELSAEKAPTNFEDFENELQSVEYDEDVDAAVLDENNESQNQNDLLPTEKTNYDEAEMTLEQVGRPGFRWPGGRWPGGRWPGGRWPGGRWPGRRWPPRGFRRCGWRRNPWGLWRWRCWRVWF